MNKKPNIVLLLLGLSLITIIMFSGCIGENNENTNNKIENKVIKVVMIPDEDPTKMLEDMKPLFDKLESNTGYKFEVNLVPDYTAAVEALLNRQADMAFLGPFTYVSAHKRDSKIIPFAMEVSAKTGKPTYHSIIVVSKKTYDNGITDLKTLKEHSKEITFAFVDPKSTSGYLMPYSALLKVGINPEKDFKKVTFAGGHDAVELAVKEGTVNAGADNDMTYPVMIKKGLISNKTNIIIWESDPIPGYPWTYREDTIPQDIRDKIKNTFLSMNKDEALKISGGRVIGYVETSPKDYQGIEDAAVALGKL